MKGFGDHYKSQKKSKKAKSSQANIINQAINFHVQGKIKEAIKYYKHLINQGCDNEKVFSNYGIILKDQGKLKEAELSTRNAIEINSNFADAHSNLGYILKDQGKLKEAELSTRKAIEIKPDFANAHYNLGNILNDQGKLKEAELYYRRAIEIQPNLVGALTNLGKILNDQGKLKDAEIFYRKAIAIKPNLVGALTNLGNILNDQGESKQAELYYRKAIEIKPDFAEAHYNLGNILKDQGKLKDAEIFYRKAIAIKPNLVGALTNLGNILNDQGESKQAELYYRKAIEIKPDFAEAHSNLGKILNDQGKLKEAEIFYRRAIEIKPDFGYAYFNLFNHYEQINNLEKLEKSLDEFKEIISIENEQNLFRARLNFRNKDHQIAKKLIDNISSEWIEKSNKSQKAIFWNFKGFINDKVGNYDLAYSCFEKSTKNQSYEYINKDSYLEYINSYKENIKNKKTSFNKFNDGIEDSNLAFLLGFPRSGTTLLDTILRGHRDIEVIEEKPLISNIEKLIKEKYNTKLNNLYNISEDNIINLRRQYFELIGKYKTKNTNYLIDKLPLNTVSLPLINLIFPNAKIIFTHRHPYDTVLSCFQQSFKPNTAMANLMSLQSASIMYDLVMDAWDIYKTNLNLDVITSKYENLIESFDSHTLKILDFLEVEWDENVKKYRETAIERGKINTPSSSQVVQPLYKSSIKKWKNYEKYFEDCHQYLKKWVSYFNY